MSFLVSVELLFFNLYHVVLNVTFPHLVQYKISFAIGCNDNYNINLKKSFASTFLNLNYFLTNMVLTSN